MLRPLLFVASFAAVAPGLALASDRLERTYAERVALLETDTRCALFPAQVRAALEAGAAQARGALLRAGVTMDRANRLAQRARTLSTRHACTADPVRTAATSARVGFEGFIKLSQMRFDGGERSWMARRQRDLNHWFIFQELGEGARFGLRLGPNGLEAAVSVPVIGAARAPGAARLVMRDPRRAPVSPLDIPGRPAGRLSANAPHQAMAARVLPIRRQIVDLEGRDAGRVVIFSFPLDTLMRLAALDPREAATIEIDDGASQRQLLIEIGDLAAALAFLRAGPALVAS
jgi:hypothetical protein